MDSFSTVETIDLLSNKAVVKSKLNLAKLTLLGIMAGVCIALGYLAFVRVSGTAPKEWGSFNSFLGACLFPIGLIALTFLGGELVTGNMMVMTFGWLEKKTGLGDLASNWILVLITNCIGGLLVALFFGHIVGLTEGDFAAKTIAVAAAKVGDSPLQAIVSGVGCNIFVCMAVFLGAMSKSFVGKLIGIWFPIMIFVVSGFQHVVANAFILPAAIFAGGAITWGQALANIVYVFIGNAISGALFLAVPVYFANRPAKVPVEESVKNVEQVI
jgi:formate/nitrite transporter